VTKTLTKPTNCAFRTKTWRGTTKKNFRRLRRIGAPTFALDRCPRPTFKFVPAPLPTRQCVQRLSSKAHRRVGIAVQLSARGSHPHPAAHPAYTSQLLAQSEKQLFPAGCGGSSLSDVDPSISCYAELRTCSPFCESRS